MERRYLLDTMIVVFFFLDPKKLERDVQDRLYDYNNLFYVSTTSVKEIIHLYNIGKIKTKWKSAEDILLAIENANFHLLPVKREHLMTYAALFVPKGNTDPNDHIIVSQAITEQMSLISTDLQFEQYLSQDLRFIFNKR